MRPHIVADVGNSRVKWGLCAASLPNIVEHATLPEDPDAWEGQLTRWELAGPLAWVLASVRPEGCVRLEAWLRQKGHRAHVLRLAEDLPLSVRVAAPDRVGIDRLLNAVAAKRLLYPGEPAILVDAGSAVTVDWLDESHAFCGGTIFPGLRLMAQALHNYTALLPLVTVAPPVPAAAGADTVAAMQAGIWNSVLGGIERIAGQLAGRATHPPRTFVCGGDAAILYQALNLPAAFANRPRVYRPTLTLEGILISAEALPE